MEMEIFQKCKVANLLGPNWTSRLTHLQGTVHLLSSSDASYLRVIFSVVDIAILLQLRLIFEEVKLPLNLPVLVNMHEAQAYCNWLSRKQRSGSEKPYRLLTEVEHHRCVAKSVSMGVV